MNTTTWIDDVENRVSDRLIEDRVPRALTVLYDPACSLCRRCRAWMEGQERYLPLRFLACTGEEARKAYGNIPWLEDELVVVGDGGEVWVGPAAFLVCLWALVDWREWSFRLAGPAFAPLAEKFFLFLSSKRRNVAALFDHDCQDGSCRIGGSHR
jgi:predicted DCC family thiol-disulfide oxidoreductase YuxK